MQMPIGVHAGTPLHLVPTAYLLWLVSQDAIRHKRWPLIEAALDVLAERFTYPGLLRAELMQRDPPPNYWRMGKQATRRENARRRRRRWLEFRRQRPVQQEDIAGLPDHVIARRITALGGLRR